MNSNGKTITFSYDPKGIRNSKTVNGVKHDYVLEGTKLIRDAHNGVDYVYDAEDQVCGMVYDGNAYYFYKNLQGDVIAITNAKGVEIARYSYDAWGVCTITGLTELGTTVANKNVFRYRSYLYDADLGWYYLQSRYYDPQTGRFINGDEVAYLGANETALSYNLFIYCESDPVNSVDRNGFTTSKKASSLYVQDLDIPNKQLVQEIRMTFAPEFINFMRFRVKNAKEFQYAWEESKRSEIVVIDTHADYDRLTTHATIDNPGDGIPLFRETNLATPKFNLMARVVILLGCNAGHYDHRHENIAYYIAQKLPYGIVVASDGLTRSTIRKNAYMLHQSEGEEHWSNQREETFFYHLGKYQYGLRPRNYGWLIYKKGWQEPYITGRLKFHTCELFAYLAHRKFYNGWAKFWRDQTAYN